MLTKRNPGMNLTLNPIFNVDGPTTGSGIPQAKLEAEGTVALLLGLCPHPVTSAQKQGLLNGDFTKHCHLCKIKSCDKLFKRK